MQEGLARRSPTPEPSSTTASSPSSACAGLTLEGEAGSGENNQNSDTARTVDNTRLSATKSILSGIVGQTRSASPAKRTRSEMNNEGASKTGGMDCSSSSARDRTTDSHDMEPESKHTRLENSRHRREASVDMLAYENDGSAGAVGKGVSMDDSVDGPSSSAYLTPQSGVSVPSSSSVNPKQFGPTSTTSQVLLPSIDDQIAQVSKLAQAPMQDGQKGYIISKEWLDRVVTRGTQTHKSAKMPKDVMESVIGPVDNTGMNMITDPTSSGLVDEKGEPFVPLKPNLQISQDYEVIPQGAWDLIVKWYGLAEGSPVVTRYCHNTTTSETMENLQFELHPPVFTILKLPDRSGGSNMQTLKENNLKPVKLLASRYEGFQKFLAKAKAAVGIETKTKVRVWRLLSTLQDHSQAGMLTPAQSRSASPAPNIAAPVDPGTSLVVDPAMFLSLQDGAQRELLDVKDETANENYNGRSNLSLVGLSQDDVIILEEQIGGPAGGEWVSGVVGSNLEKNGVPISVTKNGVTNNPKPRAITSNGRTSPAPASGIMTRGRTQKNGRTRGTVGLGNLGNTCYMNSALQCVRSVEELTMYFLEDEYKKELNPRNPLSHNGDVAKAYATLLRELYGEHTNSSFSPRNFKQIIGKYGPSFSGYGQQDSQEFLLFLLDGLQEDLNRIKKKPYIEKPDSTDEMVNNPVALREMADKCWTIYKARNDSVITDLFAGMYKSTVVCPVCEKVSIIFDPFNNLTLQLPIENTWSRIFFYFPLLGWPIRVDVDIDRNASFFAIKEFVGSRLNVDPKKMVIAELYKHRFYKMFDDKTCVSDERLQDGDVVAIFELETVPSNYPPPKKKSTYSNSDEEEDIPVGDSPLADAMMVPVFNRVVKGYHSKQFAQKSLFGVGSYIIITRDEARDYDSILRKVLTRMGTMTTRDILRVNDDRSDTESTRQDSDTVLMTTDDADSSSDSKVKANSVESEDGMVDITMKDAEEENLQHTRISYPPRPASSIGNSRLMKPEEFIEPDLRNMFEMKYFSSNEMIPTGGNDLQEESKSFPTIASRIPKPRTVRQKRSVREQLAHRIKHGGSGNSSDEDLDDPPPVVPNITSSFTNGEDSDGSDGFPPVAELINPDSRRSSRSYGRTSRTKAGLITYSHKGKQRNLLRNGDEVADEEAEAATNTDEVPLVRLGEGIVLDWTQEAYDALFRSKEKYPNCEGVATWEGVPLRPDPQLHIMRDIRESRRRNGFGLEDCLDEFGKSEILSENDAWFCPRCKEHRRASKQFELWKAPDILVIHLKRFSAQGRLRDKLDVFVDFPVQGLDLSSRVAMHEERKSLIYDLIAVDNHFGGMGGGHYTAYAQNFYDKNWYEYNDSMASRKHNPAHVVTSAAYLLFYRRRSTAPLGGPFFEKILHKGSNVVQEPPEPVSRAGSPSALSGEDKRLDDFSRLGSSSALPGVGAAHQAGNGGVGFGTLTTMRTRSYEDSLPGYSENLPDGERTLESMEVDGSPPGLDISAVMESGWQGFRPHSAVEPTEDNMDNESTKANSSTGATDDGEGEVRLVTDFGHQDNDFKYGTPEQELVEEVRLEEEGNRGFKLE